MSNVKEKSPVTPDTSNFVYVTVPEKDTLDREYPTIELNRDSYGPGTHLVSQKVADYINERMAAHNRETLRLYRPNAPEVVRAINKTEIKVMSIG